MQKSPQQNAAIHLRPSGNFIPPGAAAIGSEKVSIDSLRDLYNPTDNTINLTKLSEALKLETPTKQDSSIFSNRGRSLSHMQDHQQDEDTIQGILSLTLQKLKRRPAKAIGKLKPISDSKTTQQHIELNPQPKINPKSEDLVFLDDLTQEDKFYLIQQIESNLGSQKNNIRYDHKNYKQQPDSENAHGLHGDHESLTPIRKNSIKI